MIKALVSQPSRLVVSAPARAMHVILALSFAVAYLTGDSDFWQTIHFMMGYTILGAVGLRLMWGWIGPRSEQPKVWIARSKSAWAWAKGLTQWPALKDLTLDKVAQHAVSASIVAMLLLVVGTAMSGWVMSQDLGSGWVEDMLSEVHEFLAEATLIAIGLHLAAVAALTLFKGKGWPMRMWHGRVAGKGPDLVKSNGTAIALTLAALTAGFWIAAVVGWVPVA